MFVNYLPPNIRFDKDQKAASMAEFTSLLENIASSQTSAEVPLQKLRLPDGGVPVGYKVHVGKSAEEEKYTSRKKGKLPR